MWVGVEKGGGPLVVFEWMPEFGVSHRSLAASSSCMLRKAFNYVTGLPKTCILLLTGRNHFLQEKQEVKKGRETGEKKKEVA